MTRKTLPPLFAKICAEMVGTFALVFAGCGAIVVDQTLEAPLGHIGVCAVFGLVIMAMIYATGHISGAHFNPAVTLAFASSGRFPWKEVPGYIVGQFVAATAAAGLLWICLDYPTVLGTTVPSVDVSQAFCIEVILTFFLMFVITAVATDARAEGSQAGLAIGGTVAFCAMMGGPLTGASMNPARTLGPALIMMEITSLWLYFLAPILGATLGAATYHWIKCGEEKTEAGGCC